MGQKFEACKRSSPSPSGAGVSASKPASTTVSRARPDSNCASRDSTPQCPTRNPVDQSVVAFLDAWMALMPSLRNVYRAAFPQAPLEMAALPRLLGLKNVAGSLQWKGDERGAVMHIVPRDSSKATQVMESIGGGGSECLEPCLVPDAVELAAIVVDALRQFTAFTRLALGRLPEKELFPGASGQSFPPCLHSLGPQMLVGFPRRVEVKVLMDHLASVA